MYKVILLTLIVFLLGNGKIFSQSEVQNTENEINNLSFVKQILEDSLNSINQKIDSLQSVISSLNFEELSGNQKDVKIKVGAAIYKEPTVTSGRILTANGDSRTSIVEIDGSNYVKVNIDGVEGYAPKWTFEDEDYINALITEFRNRQPKSEPEPIVDRPSFAELREVENQTRKNNFFEKNPDVSEEIKNQILNGIVSIGMTREMVEASLGKPRDINSTVTANFVKEQWVYGTISNRRYLYFTNGILDAFQE